MGEGGGGGRWWEWGFGISEVLWAEPMGGMAYSRHLGR